MYDCYRVVGDQSAAEARRPAGHPIHLCRSIANIPISQLVAAQCTQHVPLSSESGVRRGGPSSGVGSSGSSLSSSSSSSSSNWSSGFCRGLCHRHLPCGRMNCTWCTQRERDSSTISWTGIDSNSSLTANVSRASISSSSSASNWK